MTMSLFNRDEDIIRSVSKGYLNEYEEFVAGQTTLIPIKCNIQPYREGTNSFITEAGVRTMDVIIVYTPSTLQASDEDTDIVGDQLMYKGRSYFCKDLEQWDEQDLGGTSLIPVHNVGYFYRKDVQ
jgi:hypothetical protein